MSKPKKVTQRNQAIDYKLGSKRPIAIVGMGCRFPGANNLAAFWRLLTHGEDAITEIPTSRFDIEAYYSPQAGVPGKIVTRWGGFLEEIESFDYSFFSVSPREAASMDPQQRVLLEVAWEALEDAGLAQHGLPRDHTGVFVGECHGDYEDLMIRDIHSVDIYSNTGGSRSAASGRLSYAFDLRGPSLTVDTSTSSSLVAVHLACQSLWSQECTLALAGGANIILQPEFSIGFSRAEILSPDGRCKAFDAQADGFVRSEGAGIVILKPLAQALADGDPIYALICGSAVNNDGRSSGLLMTPGQAGQEAVLRAAYDDAGISPGQIHYVETHGTGTRVGDLVEAQALGSVLAENRAPDQPCLIGSVKSNIGHTEAAAGIAGLIKLALSIKHRTVPASLHCQTPTPNISWQELLLVPQTETIPWPVESGPARGGVSSFGVSGTNAHVVLEEAPPCIPAQALASFPTARTQLLPLSTKSEAALSELAREYRSWLTNEEPTFSLENICYTASTKRAHHDHRLALVAQDQASLLQCLDTFLSGQTQAGMSAGHSSTTDHQRIVFIFSGQGSQWIGMGRTLLTEEPVFRDTIERCELAMGAFVEWSLQEQLSADKEHSRLHEIDVVQPTLCAIQIALTALWRSWGVEPDAVVGHSLGEVAAAHVAGALSLEDAVRVICHQSQLLRRVSGKGGMAVVGLPIDQAHRALEGYEERLSVAASNGPTSTVLSGEVKALNAVMECLQHQEVFVRPIKGDVACHSPQVDALCPDLLNSLTDIKPRFAAIPIYSPVLEQVGDGQQFNASYWVRNFREPVMFSNTMQSLIEDGYSVFIEISPHPILLSAVQQHLQHHDEKCHLLPTLRREEERGVMLESLGKLYSLGHMVDWDGLYPFEGEVVQLPTYPWQRERCWLDDRQKDGGGLSRKLLPRRQEDGVASQDVPGDQSMNREMLLASPPEEQVRLLETYLAEQIAAILRLSATKLNTQVLLTNLGLDSLMAVELRNRIERELSVTIPQVSIIKGVTIAQLASQILNRIDDVTSSSAPRIVSTQPEQLLAQIEELPDEQIDALLEQLLMSGDERHE